MTKIIKRDGKREPFDADKLRRSIEAAARESKISDERARKVVERVARSVTKIAEKKREIETRAISERILKELDATEPAVSEAWRNFDKTKATRSN
ncbi:MAG: ATP cone domain-containing protein [Nanoarchaeota archaeon]